jgi:hypothetical protein
LDGWYGLDCSVPSLFTDLSVLNASALPPWITLPEKGDIMGSSREGSTPNESKKKVIHIQKKRPLIYIYDLPGKYTFHHYEVEATVLYEGPVSTPN